MTSAGNALPDQLRALIGDRRGTLASNLVIFAQLLKAVDFDITSGRVIDAGRGLAVIDVAHETDVRQVLRSNFVSTVEQLALFDQLFELFWRSGPGAVVGPASKRQMTEELPARSLARSRGLVSLVPQPAHRPQGENPSQTSGDVDLLTAKDFSDYTDQDVQRVRHLIRQLAPKLATAPSRRRRPARSSGTIDLRRSLRHAVRYGGEVIELQRQRRRQRKLRLVLLCDVSGSMDSYARFLVQVLYAMQNELRGVSTFVFSTRLNEVTHLLKSRSFDDALAQIAEEVDSWSGGTSIGGSLDAFERRFGRRLIDSRTVIIILSDGWDRGDTTLLIRAMKTLQRRAHTIIWLNPLLGNPDYRPVAKGMAAALPYVDSFLPAHNLESLTRLGRTLEHLGQA